MKRNAAVVLLAAGCTFEPTSGSGPSSVGPDTTGTTGTATPPRTSSSSTTATGTTTPGTSGTTGTPTPASSESTASGTSGSGCAAGDRIIVDFLQINVVTPMTFDLEDEPIRSYAYSPVPGKGTVSFDVDIECPGEYALWALVYDQDTKPFSEGGNADAFAVQVDGGGEAEWSYGCSTLFQIEPWSYERVGIASVFDCGILEDVAVDLEAGAHTITFRNLEEGEHGEDDPGSVAAVARIALSLDPEFRPDPDLD